MRYLILLFLLFTIHLSGQVIGADLINFRVKTTAQMDAITTLQGKKEGSLCYNTTTKNLYFWNGTEWIAVGTGGGGGSGGDLFKVDIDEFVELNTIVGDKNLANTNDAQTFTSKQIFNDNIAIGNGITSFGFDDGASGQRWGFQESLGTFQLLRQQSAQTTDGGSWQEHYTFNSTGALSSGTDVVTYANLDTFTKLDNIVADVLLSGLGRDQIWTGQNNWNGRSIFNFWTTFSTGMVVDFDGDVYFLPASDISDKTTHQRMGVDESGYWYFEPVANALGLDGHFNMTGITANRTWAWPDHDMTVTGVHPLSPEYLLFSRGTTAALDAITYPNPDIVVEIPTDGDVTTDAFITSISITGTATKTVTITRNGLPDLTTNFTDDGGAGGGDGNDFLTGVSESGDILTFAVQNQTDPTFDIGTYLSGKGYFTTSNDGAGSGLDADLFDALNSTQFIRSDVADTKTAGNLTFNDNVKNIFGTDGDFEIFHNGTANVLNLVAGDLLLTDNGATRVTFGRATGNINTPGSINGAGITGTSGTFTASSATIAIDPTNRRVGTTTAHDLNLARNGTNKITIGSTVTTLQNTVNLTDLAGSATALVQVDASGNLSRSASSYAAGSFSPTLTGATSGNYTFTTQVAEYVRTGRMVYFNVILTGVSGTSPTGELRLGGLPFSSGWANQVNGYAIGLSTNHYILLPEVFGSYIRFQVRTSNTAQSALSNADFTSGTLHISGTYMTP